MLYEVITLAELSVVDRARIFNLGYFTWVEQQGVSLDEVARLVDRPVEVEHEVDRQAAHVVQDVEAVRARVRDVVVDDA